MDAYLVRKIDIVNRLREIKNKGGNMHKLLEILHKNAYIIGMKNVEFFYD